MSFPYNVNKTDFPAGPIDLVTWRAELDADPAITIKAMTLPIWISADEVQIEFAAPLSEDEDDALIANAGNHSGVTSTPARRILPDGTPLIATTPTYIDGLSFVERSIAAVVTPPGTGEVQTISIADFPIITELKISGGEYQINSEGIVFGDLITFALVDKDGLIHAMTGGAMGLPAGQVYYIHKFVDDVHMVGSYRGIVSVSGEGVDEVSAGFYLRMMVKSNVERADPNLASETAEVIGRFRVYE